MMLRQFRGELRKLAARKRTWLGFGVFAAIELIMTALLQFPNVHAGFHPLIESRGYAFRDYFSGLTIALLTMRTTAFFIGALFLAMVGSEIVAKEVEDGALRMSLCRPVRRSRLLALKYSAIALYTAALGLFIGLFALGVGLLFTGTGGFFAFGFQDHVSTFHPFREGLVRFLAAVPLLALSLLTITSLGFLCSCCDMKPAAAAVSTLAIFLTDLVFRATPFFDSIQSWFLTTRMSAWMQVFQPQIPWLKIAEDYTLLLSLDASFFIIGWMIFEHRDLKA